jgi:carbon-monoxide dehydrogenase catalytic subunit
MEKDPHEIAIWMIEALDRRREALGIHKKKERVLFDMAMRREL